ncbi:MAG TPA: GNAT family N-acetyltransferase [Bacteroidia bacterium]|nr:GNAT family N-acetyltransferase [Bacteroidia bacterium]HNT79778.1 GNAT family N-acetyltransferase [Bacteroidia bacterium]
MFYIICKKARKERRDAENKKKDPHFTIHSSVADLKEEGIILSTASHPMVSLSYFESLERSEPLRMKFYYCVAWKNGNPIALYPLQLYTINLKTLDDFLDLNAFEPIKVLNGHASFLQKLLFTFKSELHVLVAGNAFITGPLHTISLNDDNLNYAQKLLPEVLDFAEIELSDFYKIHGIVVKDFLSGSDSNSTFNSSYNKITLEPCMEMELHESWKTFEDYKEALSSKYRVRINKAQEKFGTLNSKILSKSDVSNYSEDLFKLYEEMHNKATIRFSMLSEIYFKELINNLSDEVLIRGFFDKKKMVAFTVSLHSSNHFEAHIAGMDYSYNRKYSLYLNLLTFYLSDAIQLGCQKISFGRTATAIKSSIGAIPKDAICYLKVNKPLSFEHLKPYINTRKSSEDLIRSPFKTELTLDS